MSKFNVKKLRTLAQRMPDVSYFQAVQFVSLLAAAEKAQELTEQDVRAICVDLGRGFNRIRHKAGITRKQFCEKAAISDAQLSLLEQGKAQLYSYAPALFAVMLHASEHMAAELLARYEAEMKESASFAEGKLKAI